MERRKIGALEVSVVGLGCNNFGMKLDADATAAVVHAALDHDINFFDTADIYGNRGQSEEQLGKALGKKGRAGIVLATKFGGPMGDGPGDRGAGVARVKQAVDASLRRLDTDWIDLYQLHMPDADTPIIDTLGALDELARAGKVREIGCSNFSAEQIEEAAAAAADGHLTPFRSLQNEWSLLQRAVEPEVLSACRKHGLAVLPYFPLASGLLTGKYRRGEDPAPGTRLARFGDRAKGMLSDERFDVVERLTAFATSQGHTLLELAVSWLAAHDETASVIAGATTPEQVAANAGAGSWRLTADDLAAVDEIVPLPSSES